MFWVCARAKEICLSVCDNDQKDVEVIWNILKILFNYLRQFEEKQKHVGAVAVTRLGVRPRKDSNLQPGSAQPGPPTTNQTVSELRELLHLRFPPCLYPSSSFPHTPHPILSDIDLLFNWFHICCAFAFISACDSVSVCACVFVSILMWFCPTLWLPDYNRQATPCRLLQI